MNLPEKIWILTVFFLLRGVVSETIPSCSSLEKCRCTNSQFGIKADCSSLHLSVSPVFHRSVAVIDLSFNFLQNVPEEAKLPRNIQYLNVSNNMIVNIKDNAFWGLKKLVFLNLSKNQFSLDFPKELFRDLGNLKTLDLKGCSKRNDVYPTHALSYLQNLEALYIDGLPHTQFDSEMKYLSKLAILDVSGITGTCEMPLISNKTFQYLRFLIKLDISFCRVKHIHVGSFSFLNKLQELIISENRRLSFKVLKNVTYDLQFTSIKIFRFEKIHCKFGMGTQIRIHDIKYLRNTTIQEVHVGGNRIERFENGLYQYFPDTLRFISGPYNAFTFGSYLIETCNFAGLEKLDASYNNYVKHIDLTDVFCDDGSSQNIEREDKRHHHPYYRDNVKSAAFDRQPVNIFHFCFPPKLKELHLNNMALGRNLRSFTQSTAIETLYLQNNFFYQWLGTFLDTNQLKVLDLSNNFCLHVSNTFFDNTGYLETLLLNKNYLGPNLASAEHVRGDVFKNLRKLRRLEMSQNKITTMSSIILKNVTNLLHLDLSNNAIREWNVVVDHLQHLQSIDLSYNQISSFSKSSMENFDELARKTNIRINLFGNSLQCTCETRGFIRWMYQRMVSNKIIFDNFRNYTCLRDISNTNVVMNFTDIEERISELDKICESFTGLIAVTTCCIVIFLFVLCFGLAYRYRWKCRYLYYMIKSRFHGYRALRSDHYRYDAFISYADEDRSFVVSKFIPELEEQSGLRLCLHNRDFLPGYDIAENILTAVQQSKKTIAILSGNYITSYWCMYELNMARMEGIYSREGEDVLFLVIYDHMRYEDIPLTLMDLMEKKSYIEFPNDEYGDVVFWNKVRETIGHH